MKKGLSLLLMTMMVFLPLRTKAAVALDNQCSEADSNGIINCTVTYNIVGDAASELTVNLTEGGGAQVTDILTASGSEWSVASRNEVGNVWTVNLESIGVTGEGTLFRFSYRPSGSDDCKITIELGETQITVAPPTTPDEPTDNKQTGATLPYIALGTMAVVAVGAYIAVKNKAKMYRI